MRLGLIITHNVEKYQDKLECEQTSIQNYFSKPFLRSKNFREFFNPPKPDITKINTVKNRYAWVQKPQVEFAREVVWFRTWSLSYINIDVRGFAMIFLNNGLKLNSHISKFDASQNKNCTFCSLSQRFNPAPSERLRHFFYYCPISSEFAEEYFNNFLENLPIITFNMQWLLIGAPSYINFKLLNAINIELMFVNYFLYRSRLAKKLPTIRDFKFFMGWNRSILLKNKHYAQGYSKLRRPIEPD